MRIASDPFEPASARARRGRAARFGAGAPPAGRRAETAGGRVR